MSQTGELDRDIRLILAVSAHHADAALQRARVTHDPAEAMLLGDELLLLAGGHVLQSGAVEDVFYAPRTSWPPGCSAPKTWRRGTRRPRTASPSAASPSRSRARPCARVRSDGPCGPAACGLRGGRGYPAMLLSAGAVRGGLRHAVVRIGGATLHVTADPGGLPAPGECLVSIEPAAIQVWRTGEPDVTLAQIAMANDPVEVQ